MKLLHSLHLRLASISTFSFETEVQEVIQKYSSYLVWKELGGFNEKSVVPLGLYAGQLALNWAWTPVFFGAHKMGWGLVTLLLTTGTATATAASWYSINRTAAYLMVPYLAWLTMASALNYRIWKDNPSKKKPE
ncbi:Translocator protein 2 [Pitangus sulphuratus]|nr:Translocator protein 2 [Pitangus sulphuratus]